MRLRTDDEVHQINAIWLGPPKATFPWHARYVAYAIFLPAALLVLAFERQVGIGFGFFSTAWALVAATVITRLLCSRITHERPLGSVLVMGLHELMAPRARTRPEGTAADATSVRVHPTRPRPQKGGKK